ncbi:MAG: sialate O-acetylesterase [Clostridiales bacterium]|jgi:hypothetical protein|nr:sialate O-acetylesterase [Clostridiales bacterium]
MFLPNDKFDVIIQAGQSNAEGCGRGAAPKPYIPTDKVLYYSSNFAAKIVSCGDGAEYLSVTYPEPPDISVAAEHGTPGDPTGDFALSFAREYINDGRLKPGRKLLIIRAGVGGTGFSKGFWLPGGVCFSKLAQMIQEVRDANADNRFMALLWHQGEHDAFENTGWSPEFRESEYAKNFSFLVACVRNLCGRPELPVIAAGLCRDWADKNDAACAAVAHATRNVLSVENHGAFVDSDALLSNRQADPLSNDDIHFCRAALYDLGKRYYAAYKAILSRTVSPSNLCANAARCSGLPQRF